MINKGITKNLLRDIKERLGDVPRLKYQYVTSDTEVFLQFVISFLPKCSIKFCENKIFFHETRRIKSREPIYAFCFDLKNEKVDYLIAFDSTFARLSLKYKLFYIAHELGHIFTHSQPKKSEKENEDKANLFAKQLLDLMYF